MIIEAQRRVEIQLCADPWDTLVVDAFVVPTTSWCEMSRFPASAIRELAGAGVERELAGHTPLAVGAALVTSAGDMRARHLIHVANTDAAEHAVEVEGVRRATAAVLLACVACGFSTIAFPLMGEPDRGVPPGEAARAIVDELETYQHERPLTVLLLLTTESPDERASVEEIVARATQGVR